jgi:type 1 fimbriae regulatory protein FimB
MRAEEEKKNPPTSTICWAGLGLRDHLTKAGIASLIKAVKNNRYGLRASTMILVDYTHGLVSEWLALQWADISFEDATLHIRRAKGGITGLHPLRGD